ncbi:MAG: hypothetical protein H6807_15220 [Planctomycetes bacterium]|nr:hypothetical protein [Planctomycetota bacterium]
MMNEAVTVFRRQYLIDTGVAVITSSPIEARGNEVVLSVLLINAVVSGGRLIVYLEGSYDGQSWFDLATNVSLTAFGHGSASKSGLDSAYVRLRAVAEATAEVIFDATVAFSEQ